MATISMDYEKVAAEIKRLETVASELQAMQANAQNILKDISSYWEGAAANEFGSANKRWCDEIKSIGNEITLIAGLIRKVADEIKAAEERAVAAITESAVKAVNAVNATATPASNTAPPQNDAAKAAGDVAKAALGATNILK